MEMMFAFIDMAQRGEHLATELIQKHPTSVSRSVDSQAHTILEKQKVRSHSLPLHVVTMGLTIHVDGKQLQEAAGELTKAADRLRSIVAREKRYYDELLVLRKDVKLRGRGARAIMAEYAPPSSAGTVMLVNLARK